MKTVYGWEDDGKFYVSLFKKPSDGKKRPANPYDNQADAIRDAEKRGVSIEWQ